MLPIRMKVGKKAAVGRETLMKRFIKCPSIRMKLFVRKKDAVERETR